MIDIASILGKTEQVDIEAKLAADGVPDNVWDTYSSFANTFGGTILLGVEEEKKTKRLIPRGVNNPESMISNIWNTLNNRQKISSNILLERHVYKVDYSGMWIVVFEVPRADRHDKPFYVGQDKFKGSFGGTLKVIIIVTVRKSYQCCAIRQIRRRMDSCLRIWSWTRSTRNPFVATVFSLITRNLGMCGQNCTQKSS